MEKQRISKKSRKTGETNISFEINIDGKGDSSISSPVGMLYLMLDQIARHGLIDIKAEYF